MTLEVSSQQAERAAVAQQLGRLTLTLRAAEEAGVTPTKNSAVYGGDVSSALGAPIAAPSFRMRVIQGTENQEITFR